MLGGWFWLPGIGKDIKPGRAELWVGGEWGVDAWEVGTVGGGAGPPCRMDSST
jgi:hypothetical protein